MTFSSENPCRYRKIIVTLRQTLNLKNMANQWFEKLPPSCPPSDSVECDGVYYRVSYGNPAESKDFSLRNSWHPIRNSKVKALMNV